MNDAINISEAVNTAVESSLQSTPNLPHVASSVGWLIVFVFLSGLSGILYGFYFGIQEGYSAAAHHTNVDATALGAQIKSNLETPMGRTATAVLQFICIVPVIFFAAKFPSQSAMETLAIKKVPLNIAGRWVLYFVGYWLLSTMFLYFMKMPDGAFLQSLRGTKHLGLAITIVVIAPIIEELIFRGYLYKAWRYTRLGFIGALVLISALFAAIHAGQYQWPILLVLFCFALLIGAAREKTGSVLMPMLLHGLNNAIAAILLIYLNVNI